VQVVPTVVQVVPTAVQVVPTAAQVVPTTVQVVPTAVQVVPTAVQVVATSVQVVRTSVQVASVFGVFVGADQAGSALIGLCQWSGVGVAMVRLDHDPFALPEHLKCRLLSTLVKVSTTWS